MTAVVISNAVSREVPESCNTNPCNASSCMFQRELWVTHLCCRRALCLVRQNNAKYVDFVNVIQQKGWRLSQGLSWVENVKKKKKSKNKIIHPSSSIFNSIIHGDGWNGKRRKVPFLSLIKIQKCLSRSFFVYNDYDYHKCPHCCNHHSSNHKPYRTMFMQFVGFPHLPWSYTNFLIFFMYSTIDSEKI